MNEKCVYLGNKSSFHTACCWGEYTLHKASFGIAGHISKIFMRCARLPFYQVCSKNLKVSFSTVTCTDTVKAQFIRHTCSIAWEEKQRISQSHDSNLMHLGNSTWWTRLAAFQRQHQCGEKSPQKIYMTLNVTWLLVPDGLVWAFEELLIYWYFHAQEEGSSKKRKYPMSCSSVNENVLLMSKPRVEWVDWLKSGPNLHLSCSIHMVELECDLKALY